MPEPKIFFGDLEQPLHTNAEYLLMKAGIENGTYSSQEFIDAINNVSLENIRKEECKRDLEIQRQFLNSFSQMGDNITISNYSPDKEKLESFVNTTFREMYDELHR